MGQKQGFSAASAHCGFPSLTGWLHGEKLQVWGGTSRTTTPSVHLGTPARGTRGCSGARHAGTCSRQLRAGAPPGRLLPAGPGAAGRASGRRSAMLESIRVTGEYRCRGCCPGAGAEAGAEARRRRFPRSRRGKHAGWAMWGDIFPAALFLGSIRPVTENPLQSSPTATGLLHSGACLLQNILLTALLNPKSLDLINFMWLFNPFPFPEYLK